MSDARTFFGELLPKVVVNAPERFLSLRGTIAIAVAGVGGWTIRFGSLDQPIADSFDSEADLLLWFGPTAFAEFIDGKLDVEKALATRKLRLRGDAKLMEKLGFLFEVGGSPLNTLLAARASSGS